MPNAVDAKKIRSIMSIKAIDSTLSDASYPEFYPHITLLSSLPTTLENDLESIQSSIPQRDTPLKCTFASLDTGTAYFRSVYVAIMPTVDLLDLHKQIHEKLKVEYKTPAYPHLSLVYITDEDAEKGERKIYRDLLEKAGKVRIGEGEKGVGLNCGTDAEVSWMDSFEASEIWATKCEGRVQDWRVLRKFSLLSGQVGSHI